MPDLPRADGVLIPARHRGRRTHWAALTHNPYKVGELWPDWAACGASAEDERPGDPVDCRTCTRIVRCRRCTGPATRREWTDSAGYYYVCEDHRHVSAARRGRG